MNWKKAMIGLLAGLGAGLVVLGIGGRLVMRAIMLASGETPGFSVGGTLEVLVTGLLIGAPAGVVYSMVAGRVPGPGYLKGSLFGAALFLLLLLLPPAAARSAATGFAEMLPLVLILFGVLFLLYGVLLQSLFHWLSTRV